MASEHELRWLLAIALLAVSQIIANVAFADGAGGPRVLVRLDDADQPLLARLRGQLSDVEVELVASDAIGMEADVEAQLAAARAVADTHAADGVVWLDRPQPGAAEVSVHLLATKTGELTTRRVEAKPRTRSELFEAIALVTRTVVSAFARAFAARAEPTPGGAVLARTGSMAVERTAASAPPGRASGATAASSDTRKGKPEAQARNEPPDPEPEPAQDSESASVTDSIEEREDLEQELSEVDAHVRMFAGAQSVIDGASELGQKALALRLGCTIDVLSIAFFGSAAMLSTIPDRFVNLHVARHAAGVAFQIEQPVTDNLRWAFGLHAGAVLLSRTSTARASLIENTGSTLHGVLAFGPELSSVWLPGIVGLGLHVALDVMPNVPSYAVGGTNETHALWVLEPRISLGVEARL